MEKIKVASGIYWLEIREIGLKILCGCPADSVKHLMNKGLIVAEEKNGVVCETGPNAILLSEVFLQNGQFSNLAEFPILQMLYRQGFLLPNHPNNNGQKPILLGRSEALKAQAEYIYRGNYGLVSKEELLASGLDEKKADEIMRFKLRFAFDKILSTDELIDSRPVAGEPVEIRDEVFVKRVAFNVYEFSYKGESVQVDINLEEGEEYEPSYRLGHYQIKKEYFSIIHSGDGDGWDKFRPCMSSLVTFQGKIYLVDAGPNLLHSLRALGIGVTEIEGIFHTHAHDDHFNGLTTLMGSDHKIKYYAAPLVRESAIKKFSALLSMPEKQFHDYFEVKDLELDQWNDIDGLEVRPVISPHPVETTILFFRALWGDGYKSYAHLADISSFAVLSDMLEDDPAKSGISQDYFESVKKSYLEPVNIKKIDVGGGMIHGQAVDFSRDESDKILLSHKAENLSDKEREIGSSSDFGMSDVLISTTQDYTRQRAYKDLHDYFPTVPASDLRMLLNCPTRKFNPGTILIRKGDENKNLYFVLSGIIEYVSAEYGIKNKLSVGSLAGELSSMQRHAAMGSYRAISHVNALEIPRNLYMEFLKRNGIFESALNNLEKRRFLQMTWLIGEQVSCPLKNRIARQMEKVSVDQGWYAPKDWDDELTMVAAGEIELITQDRLVTAVSRGGFFGEENILKDVKDRLFASATRDSILWRVPARALKDIPIIQWKLIETHDRRMKILGEKN